VRLFFRCNPGARDWPDVPHREGETAEVPDVIAEALVKAGVAIAVPEVAEAKEEPTLKGVKESKRK
jgi:hypothetical protein